MTRRRCRDVLEYTITVVATICCLPCICAIGGGIIAKDLFRKAKNYERPKTRERREAAERKKKLLRTIPRWFDRDVRLERHLTIGRELLGENEVEVLELKEKGKRVVVKEKKVWGKTEEQLDSPLFKLAAELRKQIWEEALGGYVFHVHFVQTYRRMSHTRCKTHSPGICRGVQCRQIIKMPGARDQWGHVELLSILQSCRRIYSEAIEILYSHNTFDFKSLDDVFKLSLTILPDRMRLIQNVQWKLVGVPTISHHLPIPIKFMNSTPWLDCEEPNTCRCIKCWPQAVRASWDEYHETIGTDLGFDIAWFGITHPER